MDITVYEHQKYSGVSFSPPSYEFNTELNNPIPCDCLDILYIHKMTQKHFHEQEHCPLQALRIYQLVVLRVIRQNYFVFEGSGGKSKDWQGECEIAQVVENCGSSWTEAWREGRQEGGMVREEENGQQNGHSYFC